MALTEFDVIERYFKRAAAPGNGVVLGIGDDAAVLQVPAHRQLVVAVDTLVAGRHFPPQTEAFDVGYKSLAVNLSDLAAMGASPAWATLSLTLPEADEAWLKAFAEGFFQLAGQYQIDLVGGDTTRGPLSVTVQVQGLVETGRALRRDGARPGQALFVTGTPGDAATALKQALRGETPDPALLIRLNRPAPRVACGLALAGFASAAIDVSDGLLADIGHVLTASRCGASLWVDRLPRSSQLMGGSEDEVLDCQLNGGDDYELCFSVDAGQAAKVRRLAESQRLLITEIGIIERQPGIRCLRADGSRYSPRGHGFDHFLEDRDD